MAVISPDMLVIGCEIGFLENDFVQLETSGFELRLVKDYLGLSVWVQGGCVCCGWGWFYSGGVRRFVMERSGVRCSTTIHQRVL